MPEHVLVSGANGFIAAHAIERLLARGHDVTATLRNPQHDTKAAPLRAMAGADAHLRLVAADLTAPDPFGAHTDVDAIMHMASPYALSVADPQRDLVEPAVEGTLSMLRAAAASKRVRRVILTSSMAAITDSPDGRVLTESDWNTQSTLSRNPYYYSKVRAERAAWDFMTSERPHFDLVVLNPFLVIGPSHTAAINTSNQTLIDLVAGRYPAVMDLTWGYVDVRDVADAHLAALFDRVRSGRYICASDTLSMKQVVGLIRASGHGARLPRRDMSGRAGTALMRLAALAQPAGIRSYLRTHLGRVPRFDTSATREALGVTFRPPEQSIRDTLADLERWGHIPARAD